MTDLEMSALSIYTALLGSVSRQVPLEQTDFRGMRLIALREASLVLDDCKRIEKKASGGN